MFKRYNFQILLISLMFTFPLDKALGNTQSAICEQAAQDASIASGVPLSVLRAISLTETGRKKHGAFQPWPWTVNMEGVGKWFDSYAAAKSYVDDHFERGARSFDVGCFQINYRWHHQAFTSIEHMFDPRANALYAAKFLSELFEEFGSWSKAAGAYHSRTPKYASKYSARFERIRANLSEPAYTEAPVARFEEPASLPERKNSFPLLQPGFQGQMASLVPLGAGATIRLIDVSNSSATPVN